MAAFINSPVGTVLLPGTSVAATGVPAPTTHVVGGLNTLHYGGSMNMKTARLGAKPKVGSTYRKQSRLETMVRLENAGLPESAAAAMLCISVPRLRTIKKSPEYLIARMQITHGIIVNKDARLSEIKAQRKELLTQMLPPALLVLANELQRPALNIAERKHQVAIAQDLLDREGTFAKVSRTEIKPVEAFDFEHVDEQSRSILNAIRNVAPAPVGGPARAAAVTNYEEIVTHTLEAVEANEAFSNSHTMSQTDQERALEKLEAEAAAMAQFDRLGEAPLPEREIQ